MDRFEIRQGSFVEVGAFDGERFSNTSWLADNGWQGIYIEPSSEFARYCRVRHYFNRVAVVCCAAGKDDSVVTFMQAGAISTISLETFLEYDRLPWARKLVKRKLEMHETRIQTLDALLRERDCQPSFELLVVDVEGYEENVFEGFDIRYWQPKLMIVELHDDHPDFQSNAPLVASAMRVRTKILEAGYIEVYRDDINTIFENSGSLAQAKPHAVPAAK